MRPRVLETVFTLVAAAAAARAEERPLDLVQPIIGTARKDQTIGAVNSGQTYPAVGVPFAMTHWTPQTQATEDKCISPYYFQDTKIQGFRGTHWWSGSCTHDYGSVTVGALTGPLRVGAEERASRFRRETEVMTPAYYAVILEDSGIRAELTGTARAGILRLTFPRADEAYVLVHANHKKDEKKADGVVQVLPGRREIVGSNPVSRLYAGRGQPAGFAGHFVARIEGGGGGALASFGTWSGPSVRPGGETARGDLGVPGGYVRFAPKAGEVVLVRVGTSFTSVEDARRNLEAEIGQAGFDEVRARAEAAWGQALGRIRVKGGTREQRTIFYTALYHALLMPRLFSDVHGSYPSFGGGKRVEVAEGWEYYDDLSLWDTFRAVHPLFVLIEPGRVPHMVRSMIAKAEQGGWLPNFPGWNSYTSAMVGDHGAAMIADAYVKGVRGFDAEKAYAAMKKNATESPSWDEYVDGKGRRALKEYLARGYISLEEEVNEAFHKREQVSRTLEYAYDDFAVAALARALGKDQDHAAFVRRARNWRNVFDPQVGFVRGRHADGRWAEGFDPAHEQPYITEGTPWQYTFFVPHDVQGLIGAVGGRQRFVAKLDRFFAEKRYWHGNEPGHHIPFLYTHAGAPWRTQEEVRRILDEEYGLGPGGIKGNDDTGQLSAWYVFAALGFYPVCPGSPHYELASPLFEEAVIDLGGGRTFTVRAPGTSRENLYVQAATWRGRPHRRPWIAHEDVAAGGTLVLKMGPRPSKTWGARPADAPPSLPGR